MRDTVIYLGPTLDHAEAFEAAGIFLAETVGVGGLVHLTGLHVMIREPLLGSLHGPGILVEQHALNLGATFTRCGRYWS